MISVHIKVHMKSFANCCVVPANKSNIFANKFRQLQNSFGYALITNITEIQCASRVTSD